MVDKNQAESVKQKRILLLILLLLLIPSGIFLKLYSGPASMIVNNKITGIVYVVFWCFLASFIFIWTTPLPLSLCVFLITSTLELLQLWDAPILEHIRSGFIGRSLIGSTFAWSDFPFYFTGALLAFILLKSIDKFCLSDRTIHHN